MRKPRIALIADVILRDASAESLFQSDYVTAAVCESISKSGGIPIVLPICERKDLDTNIKEYMDIFDGFYFVGGADIDPQFYGEAPAWNSGVFDTEKDFFEIQVLKAAYKNNKAILGNCRGFQLINVGLGGTLYQDIQTCHPEFYVKHENYGPTSPAHKPSHYVTVEKDSHLFPIIGENPFVNSRHHQAVKDVAPVLKAIAHSEDGAVEAVQTIKDDQIVAVQWHPENLWPDNPKMLAIYQDFIERTKNRMS